MKKTTSQRTKSKQELSGLASRSLITAVASLLAGWAPAAHASNVLQNSGFESGSALANWTVVAPVTWNIQPGSAQGKLYHGGANSMWTQGVYNGGANLTYAYQTVACAAGSTFSANGYFSQYVSHDSNVAEGGDNGTSGLFTSDSGGQEDGWVEVMFLDANNNVLADYRSAIMDPTYVGNLESLGATTANGAEVYLNWVNCQVTNQYDVSKIPSGAVDPDTFTSAITNTLGAGQYLVAPAGTVNVEYRLALFQALYESGATYWDDADLDLVGGPAPSVIGNVSPDGSQFFNNVSGGFQFTVTSSSSGGATLPDNPTNGIAVVVNGVDQSSHLKFTGTTKDWSVVLPTVTSNAVYDITITVSNTAGLKTTDSVVFDTFGTNPFTIYVEDYDYSGGQFIQNPVPTNAAAANSYWGLSGTAGIDQNADASVVGGGSTLVPNYPNRGDGEVAFQVASDLEMPFYAAQDDSAIYNVALSYNNAGDWVNYTRNPYPQGNYVVYARVSGGGGYGVEYLNLLTSGWGTSTQTTNTLGQFVLADGTSWSTYMWLPLTDAAGNLKVVNIPSGQQTLQLLSGGGENIIDFVFLPANAVGFPPQLFNLSPDLSTNTVFLGGTSNLTFNVASPSSTIPASNIAVTLNGTAVTPSITGMNTNWAVSVPLAQNELITLAVTVTDASGLQKAVTYSFDTFSQSNYMFEAEDFDFAGGQFIDNPVPTAPNAAADSYYFVPEDDSANLAITNVDYTPTSNTGELYNYRPDDLAGTDVTTDFIREKFVVNASSDYYIGWWNAGTWYNYTRTYPAGSFKVYGRLAGDGAYSGMTLSQVTSGRGTTNQTTKSLGSFADATDNSWTTWHWVPLLNTNGDAAVITLGGVQTLRVTSAGGANANYYMLVPVATPLKLSAAVSQGNLLIQVPTQNGYKYTVLYSTTLNGGTWQALGSSFTGTGATVTVTNAVPAVAGQEFFKVLAQ